MDNQIGIGVIGCGRWGQNLIRVFNELPESRVVLCCNRSNRDHLDLLKIRYPAIETTQDIGYVLTNSKIDAVVVATPDLTHFNISRQALSAGKHVFVEKPMAMSLAEAESLVDLAKKKGKIQIAGHIMQYHSSILWMKETLASSPADIISVLSTRIEFGVAKPNIDLLWSSVIHDVSIIQYLLANEPVEVHVVGAGLNDEGHKDILFINLEFPSGAIGHIHAGYAGPYRDRKLILHTTQDIIVFDGLIDNIWRFNRKGMRLGDINSIRDYKRQFGESQKVEPVNTKEPLVVECQHFVDCIKMNKVPLSGGENSLAVMRTLDRIERVLNSTYGTQGK
jgi:predicted dehydrogenase